MEGCGGKSVNDEMGRMWREVRKWGIGRNVEESVNNVLGKMWNRVNCERPKNQCLYGSKGVRINLLRME